MCFDPADVALACGLHASDPSPTLQGMSDMECRLPPTLPNMLSVSSMEYLGSDHEPLPPRESSAPEIRQTPGVM